jgi:exopolyphosphatase/guanosine-5'-triphosphate,3'-diphosphate pyrophosphatase
LYDLLDRESGHVDIRNASVLRLANNFNINNSQANRVSKIAAALFEQVHKNASVFPNVLAKNIKAVKWAAQLHEIGSQISHSDYHKHGAYILDNADIAGFAVPETHLLSMLVLGHRGKLKKLESELVNPDFAQQLFCLRLAVILCHARNDIDLSSINLTIPKTASRQFLLTLPSGWVNEFPQSAHLLREEVIAWKRVNWQVSLLGCEV